MMGYLVDMLIWLMGAIVPLYVGHALVRNSIADPLAAFGVGAVATFLALGFTIWWAES